MTGRLIRSSSTDGSEYRYDYDLNNNLTKLYQAAAGSNWTTQYTYDADNRPVTVTAGGKTITDTYNATGTRANRTYGFTTPYTVALTYLAGANGSKTGIVESYRNGNEDAYTYAYDANGNITSITRGALSATYAYDDMNQLVRANDGFANLTTTYTYDLSGNILERNEYDYTTGTLGTPTDTVPYTYNTTWKDQLASYDGQAITYDAIGNPLTYRGFTMTWQGKRLSTLSGNGTTASYTYNEQGVRTSKTVNSVVTNFSYNGSLLMAQVTGGGANQIKQLYSYDASGQLVSVNYNGTEYYYMRNGQNDIVGLMDSTGAKVVEYTYDSWGKSLTVSGTLATTLGANNPFRYRGYYYDTETGLYYLQTRYYDATVCRFISADMYFTTGQGIVGSNMYAYCGNNPSSRIDSAGKFFFTVLGAVTGAIIGGIFAAINGEDIWAGAAGGAVTGAITGLVTDITVATAGAAVPALVVAVGTIAGGALAGAAGDITTQVVSKVRKGASASDAFKNLDKGSIALSAVCGGLASGLSYMGGSIIKNAILEPAKTAAVEMANKYLAKEITTYVWKPIVKAATKVGLLQIAGDALASAWQTATYFTARAVAKKYLKIK